MPTRQWRKAAAEGTRALACAFLGIILKEARELARDADERGDDGTNDLLISDVIRTHEEQVWFLAEHLVEAPLVHGEPAQTS
jgi:DNA-binding ferritin-like protein